MGAILNEYIDKPDLGLQFYKAKTNSVTLYSLPIKNTRFTLQYWSQLSCRYGCFCTQAIWSSLSGQWHNFVGEGVLGAGT
jgi:hypothetical protein